MAKVPPPRKTQPRRRGSSKPPRRPREPGGPKEIARAAIEAFGGIDAAAAELGRSRSEVFRWTSEDEDGAGRFINIHHVRRLESLLGEPMITAWLAAEQGCVLLPLNLGELERSWVGISAQVAREAAEVISAIAEAYEPDAEVDRREAGDIVERMDHALGVLAALRQKLTRIRDGEDA